MTSINTSANNTSLTVLPHPQRNREREREIQTEKESAHSPARRVRTLPHAGARTKLQGSLSLHRLLGSLSIIGLGFTGLGFRVWGLG
jgi:hypothetical protein